MKHAQNKQAIIYSNIILKNIIIKCW